MPLESITIGADLAKALVAAHAELRNPKTNAENSFFSSKYVSLGGCRDAVIPTLAKHGIFVMQDLSTTTVLGESMLAIECRTILIHESGQGVRLGPLTLPVKEATAQALGSAATYGRRYSLIGATSLAPAGDDDDGNEASGNPTNSTDETRPSTPRPAPPRNDPEMSEMPMRPTGQFAYGKKFVNMPWNVMDRSQLEWFRDAERTPPIIREKCKAELAWRRLDAQKGESIAARQAEDDNQSLDDPIPF